jgi:hypothetical protein
MYLKFLMPPTSSVKKISEFPSWVQVYKPINNIILQHYVLLNQCGSQWHDSGPGQT